MKDIKYMNQKVFLMNQEEAICSLVVYCKPELTTAVVNQLNELPQTEVSNFDENGKIVVILEANAEYPAVKLIDSVQFSDGVLSTMLVYHQLVD